MTQATWRRGPSQRTADSRSVRMVLTWVRREAAHMRMDVSLVSLDVVFVVVAYGTALLLRFDGQVPEPYRGRLPAFLVVAVATHLCANWFAGLYGKVWHQASVDEARLVVLASGASGLLLLAHALWGTGGRMPISVVAAGAGTALLLTGLVRFRSRLFAFQVARTHAHRPAPNTRVVIVGAGAAARSVIHSMRHDPVSDMEPVAVIDEMPGNHGRMLVGVPIIGDLSALPRAVEQFGAELMLLALSEPDPRYTRDAADVAQAAGLDVKVRPSVPEVFDQPASVRDVRDLDITDLLGRPQVATDLEGIRAVIQGKRVLVTGGGGSIGSELARQIRAFDPQSLWLLDHDETHLHDAAADLSGPAVQVLADIRDATRIRRIFEEHRPEVVFHAAANKHVPILEAHPCEALATNVGGTRNVLDAARLVGVERFVFISTDKAVNPLSVMGATKRLGEQLVLDGGTTGSRYCAVRFGNVLGSRGSVIPTFMRQIHGGGPVTVTHPAMTRFFMSIPEAVQLVLQAAALSEGGEVFTLDMGEPVPIIDLARRMIMLTGRQPDVDVQVRFTGLRPGEKLYEELSSPDERQHPTAHPGITALRTARIPTDELQRGVSNLLALVTGHRDTQVRSELFELLSTPTFTESAETIIDLTGAARTAMT